MQSKSDIFATAHQSQSEVDLYMQDKKVDRKLSFNVTDDSKVDMEINAELAECDQLLALDYLVEPLKDIVRNRKLFLIKSRVSRIVIKDLKAENKKLRSKQMRRQEVQEEQLLKQVQKK